MKSDFAFLQFSLISIFPFLLIDVIWTMFKAETYFFRERKSHGNGKWENSKMKKVGTLKNSISSLIKITIRPRRQFLKYFCNFFRNFLPPFVLTDLFILLCLFVYMSVCVILIHFFPCHVYAFIFNTFSSILFWVSNFCNNFLFQFR